VEATLGRFLTNTDEVALTELGTRAVLVRLLPGEIRVCRVSSARRLTGSPKEMSPRRLFSLRGIQKKSWPPAFRESPFKAGWGSVRGGPLTLDGES